MKATELRIGNYINEVFIVDGIMKGTVYGSSTERHQITSYRYSQIKPIQLTEQWFKDFGFEQFSSYKLYNKGFFQVDKTAKEQDESGYWFFINSYPVNVVYVHQLQNLYFALTGRELNK